MTKEAKVFEGACKVCGGDIKEKIVCEYDPATGPPLFGPGSAKQFRDFHRGYYCTRCGIRYEFVPKKNK